MMPDKITCPACRAEISNDGETVFKESTRLSRVEKMEDEVKSNRLAIDKLQARIEELSKPKKKEGFWG
jgi:NifU-like protein involved in Fe-S cluster formation